MLTIDLTSEVDRAAFVSAIPRRARIYAPAVLKVAQEQSISPFLLVAVMERESQSGLALKPAGSGGTGDGGHGRGLMQIDDRSHADWLESANWKDPYVNIGAGAGILRSGIAYFMFNAKPGSKVTVAAETYAVKQGVPAGVYPDPRPLTGDALMSAAVAGYNTGCLNVLRAISAGKSPDTTVTGGDYSKDVLGRVAAWEAAFSKSMGPAEESS